MKRKNTMRNALFTSIISMLLCVSMLVGTTFAWFTDEVVSGMNTIAAGNLDIELLASGNKVDNTTKLFDGVEKWEPGVVVYENLEIANVGTLALKYQMTLNFKDNNDLNGHKLSEVVKVALVDKIEAGATRAQVLEQAKAAVAADKGNGNLANFYTVGELKPGETTGEKAVVVFWEPTDHDNDYNANNGQKTSDGEPLSIEFGINLQATQLMHESDSFGKDYDKEASILPKATVNELGRDTIMATIGIGGAAEEFELPFKKQFLPNESLKQAEASQYRYWHADYVIKADRDIKANSIALLGYYDAWCQYNNDYWVAMADETSTATLTAGSEIRLVQLLSEMSGGNITVNYEDICRFGNDPEDKLPAELEGFLCSAIDLTGENAGTTITVELRLYEVPGKGECANGGGCNHNSYDCEVGADKYYIIGEPSVYTFPAAQADSQADLEAALATGGDVKLAAGTYTFPNSSMKAGQTLYCEEGTVFTGASLNANGATIVGATFKNTAQDITVNGIYKDCTFEGSNGLRYGYAGETVVFENCVFSGNTYGVHFDGGENDVVLKNCTISGFNATGAAVKLITFEGCTFVGNGKSSYNGINLWGETVMTECTFVFDGSSAYEWIDLRSADKTATFNGCKISDGTNTRALTTADVGNNGGGTIVVK